MSATVYFTLMSFTMMITYRLSRVYDSVAATYAAQCRMPHYHVEFAMSLRYATDPHATDMILPRTADDDDIRYTANIFEYDGY